MSTSRVGCRKVCPSEVRGISLRGSATRDAPFRWYTLEVSVETHGAPAGFHDSLWMCGLGNGEPSTEVYLCRRCAIELGVVW